MKVRAGRPEYRGGQHFGSDNGSDSDTDNNDGDDGDDDEAETIAAQGLSISEAVFEVLEAGSGIVYQAPDCPP
jgi:hypothetical protein